MNTNLVASNLPGVILLILIIALPLAFLTSLGLLRLYRRAVIRAMGIRANVGKAESVSQETSARSQESVQAALNITVLDSASSIKTESTAHGLYESLLRGPWRAAVIYAVAGLCYALTMTFIFLAATNDGFHLLSFLVLFWYYAWPVVVTVCLVAAATWRTRFVIVAIYFLILIPLGVISLSINSALNWGQIILLWILTNFLAAVVLLAFLNRRIRAVGPFVLTFMIFAVTGSVIFPLITGNNAKLLGPLIKVGVAIGLDGYGIFIGLILLGFGLFGVLGWLTLQWIGNWYKQKKLSEQSITIDAIWLLFGVFQSVGLIFEGERWFFASLLSFVVYKIVTWAGFSFLGDKPVLSGKTPNLLLLRVFSLGKRSEYLFDALAMYWRYVGSIQLIAGPDLATTTMEPHEFLDFLSGKLARRFIDSSQTLDLRISEMDMQPDRDGQFRVNDFFCYEDTWRMVLSRLVSKSDVVLMDLRGFSSQNMGCIFEIKELINTVTLGQMAFIIDETTDELFLRQVIQQAWERMSPTSPNRELTSGVLNLVRLRRLHNDELKRLLHTLSSASSSPLQAQALA